MAFATSRGSREVAEDLAQEVFMVLHEKYSQVTELAELVPLSFQILRFKKNLPSGYCAKKYVVGRIAKNFSVFR